MPRSTDLLGRAVLVRQVADTLAAGRSVLLYGPEGIGKSAIISAVTAGDVVVADPFEHITRRQACQMRRALDRGVVHLGATRAGSKRGLGAVGRILWRFSGIRVRELPDPVLGRIVMRELRQSEADIDPERPWLREIVAFARGRPGFATAMARFAVDWHRRHRYLPMPALAFAATREDATIRSLRSVAIRAR